MTRLTLAFAVFLAFLPAATAALSPHTDLPGLGRDAFPTSPKDGRLPDLDKGASAHAATAAPAAQPFDITDDTEVWLDGRCCKFCDVPGTATVVSVDLAADGKTVVKVRFRSKR